MKKPIADTSVNSPSDTRTSSARVALRADRQSIDCGGATDSESPRRERFEEGADVRRAMDARRGTYADQVQAI